MSFRFELAYLFNYMPWARAKEPMRLYQLIGPPQNRNRAIDLGCGTGLATIHLALKGWKATGVDAVRRALAEAQRRASKAGVDVAFVQADVTRLPEAGVTGPFDLLVDRGCFHNLSEEQRRRYGASVTRIAAAGAEFLLFAIGRNRKLMLPLGAERDDIERCLAPDWHIVWSGPEDNLRSRLPPNVSATWYRLRRE